MSRKFGRWLLAPMTLLVIAATDANAWSGWGKPRPIMKWCSMSYDGERDCAFATLQQCRWAVSATGGTCMVNPRYPGRAGRPARR